MPNKNSPGCKCCRCLWTFNVTDCGGNAQVGATITLQQSGVTIATGTTDGSGAYVFSGLAIGSYDVTVDPPTAGSMPSYSGTITFACGMTTSVVLGSDPSLACVSGTCLCPSIPKTLFATWNVSGTSGSDTFTYQSFFGTPSPMSGPKWFGGTNHSPTGFPPSFYYLFCSNDPLSPNPPALNLFFHPFSGSDSFICSFNNTFPGTVTCSPFSASFTLGTNSGSVIG